MNLKPLDDRIVVKPERGRGDAPRPVSSSPTPPRRSPSRASVLAVGPGRRSEQTGRAHPARRQGRRHRLYSKYGGTEVTIDGEDLLILTSRDVLAIVAK